MKGQTKELLEDSLKIVRDLVFEANDKGKDVSVNVHFGIKIDAKEPSRNGGCKITIDIPPDMS